MNRISWVCLLAVCVSTGFMQPIIHAQIINENNACTWGILNDALAIPTDSIISDAVLTLHDVRTAGTPQATLYVQLLDNPNPDLEEILDAQEGNLFEGYGAALAKYEATALSSTPRDITLSLNQINDTAAWVWNVFDAPVAVTLGDSTTRQLSSSLLSLLDYAGTGRSFGFGLDCDNVMINGISLELTIQSMTQATTPTVLTFEILDPDAAEPIEVIIDNGQAGTSSTGTWQASAASNPYGENSLWSRNGATYTWNFTPPVAGSYEVFVWWTEWSSRSTAAPFEITHAGGTTDTTVNQQVNGGQWNSLGTYYFNESASVKLSTPGAYPTSYCADAVKFVKIADVEPDPIDLVIDNGQTGTSSTGTWGVSGGSDPFGDNSLWARNGSTYTWNFTVPAGSYEVFMWWTGFSSRSPSVPLQVNHADGTSNLTVNQQVNGGQWNSLGTFYFTGDGTVVLSAPNGYPTSYCADAIRVVSVP